jgi:hypothetical protein
MAARVFWTPAEVKRLHGLWRLFSPLGLSRALTEVAREMGLPRARVYNRVRADGLHLTGLEREAQAWGRAREAGEG